MIAAVHINTCKNIPAFLLWNMVEYKLQVTFSICASSRQILTKERSSSETHPPIEAGDAGISSGLLTST